MKKGVNSLVGSRTDCEQPPHQAPNDLAEGHPLLLTLRQGLALSRTHASTTGGGVDYGADMERVR